HLSSQLQTMYHLSNTPLYILCLYPSLISTLLFFFFFNDTATTEIYTLSLHDALPIPGQLRRGRPGLGEGQCGQGRRLGDAAMPGDRKSTRLNSSHDQISYAVFCLKKKKKKIN